MPLYALKCGYAILEKMTRAYENIICRHSLHDPDPGWLGMAGQAGKSWPGLAAE